MPIYAYKCESCGFAKDVLQKMSDDLIEMCPSCGKSSFKKQLTAAGFQLKGSGWYATDFKGGGTSAPAVAPPTDTPSAAPAPTATPAKSEAPASIPSAPAATGSNGS